MGGTEWHKVVVVERERGAAASEIKPCCAALMMVGRQVKGREDSSRYGRHGCYATP